MAEPRQWAIGQIERLVIACSQARDVGKGVEQPWAAAELQRVIEELEDRPATYRYVLLSAFAALTAALMSDVEDLGGPSGDELLVRHLAQLAQPSP
jgi:hypothetical protein